MGPRVGGEPRSGEPFLHQVDVALLCADPSHPTRIGKRKWRRLSKPFELSHVAIQLQRHLHQVQFLGGRRGDLEGARAWMMQGMPTELMAVLPQRAPRAIVFDLIEEECRTQPRLV